MPNTHRTAGPRLLFHPIFVSLGAALLIGALATDILYFGTSLMQWANFSAWLITAGLLVGLVASLALVVDVLRGRAGLINWPHFIVFTIVVLLSLLNAFVHSRDAWTSVVPEGILLSVIVTILLLTIGWRSWSVSAIPGPTRGESA